MQNIVIYSANDERKTIADETSRKFVIDTKKSALKKMLIGGLDDARLDS